MIIKRVSEMDVVTAAKIRVKNIFANGVPVNLAFSGGKDSTYTLYYLVKHYNLKPLVVQFNHGFFKIPHGGLGFA